MKNMTQMSKEDLQQLSATLAAEYTAAKGRGLKLDMSRGKPSPGQIKLAMPLLDVLNSGSSIIAEDGTDCGNYGGFEGIPEIRRIMGALLEVDPANVFIGSGSSLNLMHDLATFSYIHPLPGCDKAWGAQGEIKFLCPAPGYDRHFAVTEQLGITLVTVPMTATGPDMDVVEKLVQTDASIKGMWCVPKYSNPTGVTYSDDTVRRLAAMKPAAKDFRIFWDNAYVVHDLYPESPTTLLDLMGELKKNGNENMAFLFCSFAKVTFGGAGIAAVGCSAENMAFIKKRMFYQLISNDKINQLRHAKYFGDVDGIRVHMVKHAELLRPKFEKVQEVLAAQLDGLGIAQWTKPLGGYFVSLDTLDGCAKRALALCKEAGVIMTPAGATFAYGIDPADKNIRIAPSFPSVEELEQAAELFCLCVKMASVEKLLAQ